MDLTGYRSALGKVTGKIVLLGIATVITLLLNAYGLIVGITIVLPHLFYIPVILAAYYYPRRGTAFALVLSALYLGMVAASTSLWEEEVLQAVARTFIFILIAFVVSVLTMRMRESEERYRGVTERISDVIIVIDQAGKPTYVSPSIQKILGYEPDDMIGRSPEEFFHPEDIGRLLENFQRSTAGEKVDGMVVRFKRSDGDYAMMDFSGSPVLRGGAFTGMQVIGRDVTAKIQAEEAIRESMKRYRDFIDFLPQTVFEFDTRGILTDANRVGMDTFGFSREEISTGISVFDLLVPEDRSKAQERVQRIYAGEKSGGVELTALRRDGSTFAAIIYADLIIRENEPAGVRGIVTDISMRKKVEEALLEAHRRLTDIIDFLPDPTFVIDAEGRVSAWNRAMEGLTGILAGSILGKGDSAYAVWFYGRACPVLIDMVLRGDQDAIEEHYPKSHRQGCTIRAEVELSRPDGTRFSFWLTATPLFNQDGEVIGAIESLRDVTHHKEISRAWRESKRYLETIINTISDPVFVKDRQHRWVTMNEEFCRFLGHPREDLLGRTDRDLFSSEEADVFWQKDEEVFGTQQVNENEEDLTDNQGNWHRVVTKKALYMDESGEQFIVGIIREITERKRVELALQEANRKLNMLSSITRHDILNQLVALRGYLELSKETAGDPDLQTSIRRADESAERIERQIEFTRYYQDIGVQAPVWQDAGRLINSTATLLDLSGIVMENSLAEISIFADPLIGKVFYNLMENSLRHGGSVTRVGFFVARADDTLTLVYCDNGAGILDEDKKRLFQKGFGKHTGLGLFLSREILSITGITITENGTPGEGVRFEILVPKGAWRSVGMWDAGSES